MVELRGGKRDGVHRPETCQTVRVSPRTLRYYDEIGLLKPVRINSSGYRIYGPREVDRLQQIIFYKELGIGLEVIKKIMSSDTFNEIEALKDHRQKLLEKRRQIDLLLLNVEKTIAAKTGGQEMSDEEKFEAFKEKLINENEARYGKEIREKYGDDVVDRSNANFKNMSREDYEKVTRLDKEIKETLAAAFAEGDPSGDLAQKAADLHRQWLTFFWNDYSKEAHARLADMYVEDERFKAYYDEGRPGTTEFFRDAIHIYTGMKG
ncbi:TipAS antibiotic-recognition domain-containing protein [Tuberibacillus calidus]|uniref:TipAS antibiotic-recognition domain-containing protein n=1 Tax=Tuberibacillus calidus TaxID=340097 RepID=UPI0012DCB9DC